MNKKFKVYSVRVNFKNVNPQIKVSPRSLSGVVIALSAKEAGDVALKAIKEKLLYDQRDVYAVIGKVSAVASSFFLHANDFTD